LTEAFPEVTVLAEGERVVVRGIAAVLIAPIVLHAAHINAITLGRVVAHIANRKLHLETRHSHPSVRLGE
jgi:hypothetical protein